MGIVSNRIFGGANRLTLWECGVFQAKCGFARHFVLGAALSQKPIAPDSTQELSSSRVAT